MAKFSEDDLENLYRLAVEDGWETLEQGERVAVSRWCKKNNKPNPRDAPAAPTNIERADAAVAELAGAGLSDEPAAVLPAAGDRQTLADCLTEVFASLSRLQTAAFDQHDQVLFAYAAGILGGELAQLAANYGREA